MLDMYWEEGLHQQVGKPYHLIYQSLYKGRTHVSGKEVHVYKGIGFALLM